jgi:hypothetical protein
MSLSDVSAKIEIGEKELRVRGRKERVRQSVGPQHRLPAAMPTFVREWRAARDENGHSEYFEIKRHFENVDGRSEAITEARRLAEKLLRPYAPGQPRQNESCSHLEIVSMVQNTLQLPRRRVYGSVYRAMENLGITQG